ncbi:head decoration protein [Polymorphospora rubra]|uniref:head decoration protein n=1 Tax=Polymorphospora rubra TaxID=338584 RepID=UPI0033E39892
MNLTQRTESFGQGNQSWLAGPHGTDANIGVTLDTSTFTAGTHYPDGYFISGIPLGKITATGKYGPYASGASDGRETLVCFLMNDVKAPAVTTQDPVGAGFMHGGIVEANLPISVDSAGKVDVAGRIWFV